MKNLPLALNELITLNGGGRWFAKGDAGDAGVEEEVALETLADGDGALALPFADVNGNDMLDPLVSVPFELFAGDQWTLVFSINLNAGNDLLFPSPPSTRGDDANVAIGSLCIQCMSKQMTAHCTTTGNS